MNCPYCNESNYKSSYLPPTKFNNKIFNYVQCQSCDIIYISPFPNQEDLKTIYSPDYQEGVNTEVKTNIYEKLNGLRFSYGEQFDLIKKHKRNVKSILDYGCGSGNFIVHSLINEFSCIGVEYNPLQIDILKEHIPLAKFFTVSDFIANESEKFDVIRLSNVLEHIENPNYIILLLIGRLSNDGILIVEGPIEANKSFALFVRKFYFVVKQKLFPHYTADHSPTHLTFTNKINQLQFFEKNNLYTLEYITKEAAWPFPASFTKSKGFIGKLNCLIAKSSIILSKLLPNYGNTFIYVGRKK